MVMLVTLVSTSKPGIDNMLLCKTVYVVLFAFLCLVCYAQNQFAPNQLEPARFSNTNQLPCWRRFDGCQKGYPQRFSSPDCASVILAPDSDQIVCVPYLPSTIATTTTNLPPSYSRSIEKLLRSLNSERIADTNTISNRPTASEANSKLEQNPNMNPYYTAYREGKQNSYTQINEEDATRRANSSNECDELAGEPTDIIREICSKKRLIEGEKMRKSSQAFMIGIDQDTIVKEEDDGRDFSSEFRLNGASKVQPASIRSNREIRGGQTPGGEEDLSEPAIFIATRGLTYDQYRLRRPTIRVTHKTEGKRQQQALVDLDGGKKINKSIITSQDITIRNNKTARSENNINNFKLTAESSNAAASKQETPLECNKRQYTFKAVKRDGNGEKCSGVIKAAICYGNCDTGEIADWIFPFKKSIHKVCSHGQRVRRRVILPECSSSSVDPSLREYHYVDARSCVCQKCNPAETTCLGSLTQPHLMSSNDFGDGSGGEGSGDNGIVQTISESELILKSTSRNEDT